MRLEKALPIRLGKIIASFEEGSGRGDFDGGRYDRLAKYSACKWECKYHVVFISKYRK
jgi:hypothetical protein